MTFGGWTIPVMAIPCVRDNSKTEFTPICLVLHQIAFGLSYFAFSMHGIGISGILIMTFGG
jgi:hypothetical protein